MVTLTSVHLIRVGEGLDAVRLVARGHGFIFGTLGLFRVRGSLDVVVLRRFTRDRCRVLFVGLHGLARAGVTLPPAHRLSAPLAGRFHPPELPSAPAMPRLDLRLTLHPPDGSLDARFDP